MAIVGLRKRLPVVGKIKIGMSAPYGKPPVKFDHIELTGVQRDGQGALLPDPAALRRALDLLEKTGGTALTCGGCARADEVAKITGDPAFKRGLPRALDVMLPYNDLELNFPHEMQYFTSGVLWCHGDREKAWRRPKTGTRKVMQRRGDKKVEVELPIFGDAVPWEPCGAACPYYGKPCKPHGRLFLILAAAPAIGSCYEFYTTSWNSIENIVNALTEITSWTGLPQWLPLRFEVQPRTLHVQELGVNTNQMIATIRYVGPAREFQQLAATNLRERAPVAHEIRQLEAFIKRDLAEPIPPDEVDAIVREYDVDKPPTVDLTPIESVPLIDPLAPDQAAEPEPVPAAGPEGPAPAEAAGQAPASADDETYTDEPEQAPLPVEAEAPVPVRDPASAPERPKISQGRRTLLSKTAENRTRESGIEDGGHTLLSMLLAKRGIGSVSDVREDEFAEILAAVKTETL